MLQIIDRILLEICQEWTSGNYSSFQWVSTVVAMLGSVDDLQWPLLVRLWELLTKQVRKRVVMSCAMLGLCCLLDMRAVTVAFESSIWNCSSFSPSQWNAQCSSQYCSACSDTQSRQLVMIIECGVYCCWMNL